MDTFLPCLWLQPQVPALSRMRWLCPVLPSRNKKIHTHQWSQVMCLLPNEVEQ